MTTSVTFKLSDGNVNSNVTFNVQDKNLIYSIFPEAETKGLTTAQAKQIEQYAKRSGDENILESADFTGGLWSLATSIAKGEAYIPNPLIAAIEALDPRVLINNNIYVHVGEGVSMGEIKERFNLPDGSLRSYLRIAVGPAGGHKDAYTTPVDYVWFSIKDFAKNNGMSVDEVRELFNLHAPVK